jgi:restriction system protein
MTIPAEENQIDGAAVARWRTQQFQDRLEQTRNILRPALESKHAIDWGELISDYPVVKPSPPIYLKYPSEPKAIDEEPPPPVYVDFPSEPQRSDVKYQSLKDSTVLEYAFVLDYEAWAESVKRIEAENQRLYDEGVAMIARLNLQRPVEREKAVAKWSQAVKRIETENQRRREEHDVAIARWDAERIAHDENVSIVRKCKADYESLQQDHVRHYCKSVLSLSKFLDGSAREFDLEYVPESKILIVDHSLPSPDDLIRIKAVKYVKVSNEFVDVLLSANEFNHIYDDILYQTCLRTLHELFDADTADALSAVVFNGWVDSVDKATGREANGCVLSVHVKKEEFQKINLGRVDPKACFKALKGIGSSTLHSLTPIAPVLKINREDKRFVASHEVVSQLDERFNLAAMDWEDFEHLIRELFEKEFSKSGSEVKVTQASRDGGVDAVVFDPDPIHGGKIVIQAKRYTNTVGVAAVRELYGTVLNEGAMKGILVTTADYGPDAYEFAADKPLVLLNGGNLLSLLDKHGHKAKIDLKEAKQILGEK